MTKVAADTVEIQELVVVGSGGVGKSCLTVRFLKDEFTNDYDPTIEENYRKNITVDNSNATVNIIDTAGQHEYTALRDQHLKDGRGFLLVFACNDRATWEEIKQLRDQILKLKDTKRVPLVICGNKCDLPPDQIEVDDSLVESFCATSKIPYLKTSAKENTNVTESFHMLVRECRRFFPPGAGGDGTGSPHHVGGRGGGGRGGGGAGGGTKKKSKCTIL
ncbi:Ras- protein R-Ras2 [Geranomyces variabilis]|uniref:Ras- protein R-Ras2 n=1 Tax=Geranomyces variabilis TaxID=109894 RepID=A0AAD5TJE2_9FUNG|nr:Ras- protein R-Ras2 [Geranomyces variabilis]